MPRLASRSIGSSIQKQRPSLCCGWKIQHMPSMVCSVAVPRRHRRCCLASLLALTQFLMPIDRKSARNCVEESSKSRTIDRAFIADSRVSMTPKWLEWTQRLQAIAQTGLTYAADPYDVERYEQLREIATEIAAAHSDSDQAYVQGLFADQAGYATPKVDVRGAVFRDDMIL